MKILSKIFGKKENGIGEVEKKLAELMARKSDIGEFSIDLYYNDGCGKETCYVAKLTTYENGYEYHARYGNFIDALDTISEYIDSIAKRKRQSRKHTSTKTKK